MIDAMTAPLPTVCSTSQITTYGNCPRQYAYKYVLKVPTLVTPEAMAKGARVHEAIAASKVGTDIDDPEERQMVDRAARFLEVFPPNPVLETTYEDRKNPGRFYGDVCGHRFVGIFDVHWTGPNVAVDWKTGTYKPKYATPLETQAYILGELYRETYGDDLEVMAFVFLKSGDVHYARALGEGRSRTAAEKRIETALAQIAAREWPKKPSPLCGYCEHRELCRLGAGGFVE